MATTKKSATASKKSKAPVKKTAVRSLQRSTNDTPFFTVRFTHETLYWSILAVLVVSLAGWVVYNTVRIDELYNQIDAANADSTYVVPKKSVKVAE